MKEKIEALMAEIEALSCSTEQCVLRSLSQNTSGAIYSIWLAV